MTASDILHNADAYKRAHPGLFRPAETPDVPAGTLRITADSPATLDDEAEQIAREERWS
jgi:hypothetical protein